METKPDYERCMDRLEAWLHQEVIDRVPVRFAAHNADFEHEHTSEKTWPDLKTRWFDAEHQVDSGLAAFRKQKFIGETFPVFWPNLGPDVYASFYGCELIYGEVTSWSVPILKDATEGAKVRLDLGNEYARKIDELTDIALEKVGNEAWVGYTDLHPGMDTVAAWLDPQKLCTELVENAEGVLQLIELATRDFQAIYDRYHEKLSAHGQPSANWLYFPTRGKLHIPSCDFGAMISPKMYERFAFPILQKEVAPMTENIFHLDGKGVARHLDYVLSVPQVQAIQWVQGMGADKPIMQWEKLMKRMLDAGKSVLVDLEVSELDDFMAAFRPEGIMFSIAAEESIQEDVLQRVAKW